MRTSSPGSKPAAVEGGDHADLVQPLLEVGERFFVFGVVALEQQLDAAAEDPEAAVVLALDPVAALARGPVDAVLGLELAAGLRRRRRRRRRQLGQLGEDPLPQLVEALAGRRGDREHAERPVAEPLAPLRHRRLDLARAAAGRAC